MNEHPEVDLSHHYDVRSRDQEYLRSTFTISSYWLREVELIKKIYGGTPASVLDVGCRTGDFLLHWPKSITRAGVELSPNSSAVALSRGLDVRQGFVEDVQFPLRFAVVTAYAILEHLPSPRKFLSRITDLVDTKGVLVVMIPGYQTFKAMILETLNIRWHMYSPPEHLSLYSREFLDGYLDTVGFTLAARKYTSGGMCNPFISIPIAGRAFGKIMWTLDTHTFLNRIPVFDHMYSYYLRQ